MDTEDWTDIATLPAAQAMVAYSGTGRPDVANVMHYRGKRRFGRHCAMPLTTVRPGKTYQVRIRAEYSLGWSPFSAPSPSIRMMGTASPCAVML